VSLRSLIRFIILEAFSILLFTVEPIMSPSPFGYEFSPYLLTFKLSNSEKIRILTPLGHGTTLSVNKSYTFLFETTCSVCKT
jgi:hypothetical protein